LPSSLNRQVRGSIGMLIENPLSVRVVPFKLAAVIAGLVPAIPIRMALPD